MRDRAWNPYTPMSPPRSISFLYAYCVTSCALLRRMYINFIIDNRFCSLKCFADIGERFCVLYLMGGPHVCGDY